jgi:hypothetical protein
VSDVTLICSACGSEADVGVHATPDGQLAPLCGGCAIAVDRIGERASQMQEKSIGVQLHVRQQALNVSNSYVIAGSTMAGLGASLRWDAGAGLTVTGAVWVLAGLIWRLVR